MAAAAAQILPLLTFRFCCAFAGRCCTCVWPVAGWHFWGRVATRALLDAGADHVIGVDRDPLAFEMARLGLARYGARYMQQGVFSNMDELCSRS